MHLAALKNIIVISYCSIENILFLFFSPFFLLSFITSSILEKTRSLSEVAKDAVKQVREIEKE